MAGDYLSGQQLLLQEEEEEEGGEEQTKRHDDEQRLLAERCKVHSEHKVVENVSGELLCDTSWCTFLVPCSASVPW